MSQLVHENTRAFLDGYPLRRKDIRFGVYRPGTIGRNQAVATGSKQPQPVIGKLRRFWAGFREVTPIVEAISSDERYIAVPQPY